MKNTDGAEMESDKIIAHHIAYEVALQAKYCSDNVLECSSVGLIRQYPDWTAEAWETLAHIALPEEIKRLLTDIKDISATSSPSALRGQNDLTQRLLSATDTRKLLKVLACHQSANVRHAMNAILTMGLTMGRGMVSENTYRSIEESFNSGDVKYPELMAYAISQRMREDIQGAKHAIGTGQSSPEILEPYIQTLESISATITGGTP